MEEELLEEYEQEIDINEILKEWKRQYKDVHVAELNEVTFIYRLISKKEYEDLKNLAEDDEELEELICEACVLDPIVDWDDEIYAGFSTALSIDILEKSYLLVRRGEEINYEEIIEQKEYEISNSLELQMPIIICTAFPQYDLETIEYMPLPHQLDMLVKAKWALEFSRNIKLDFNKEE